MIRRMLTGLALAVSMPALPSAALAVPQVNPASFSGDTTPPERPRVAPPQLALAQRWMSLDVTGVDVFRKVKPLADGRGVLIAILDSGIDAGIPGLRVTSDSAPKLLDLRDFSEEGHIALVPVAARNDTVLVNGVPLAGMSRVAARTPGPWYGGTLSELALGAPPAADVNGNGSGRDLLPIVVGRASDGWVLYADTNGDGTLADEHPVHDYLLARETFGWARSGKTPALTVAANFGGDADAPALDLFFDTSGHGSHVAGIAAGHDIYGVAGLDGVAPGAQVIGLKIANDAVGGISTTESMRDAMAYAIRFATARGLPLVMNMSFGVGNEREGAARIDAIVDSVLAAHPGVVFAISAGNDGPALSTVGFPGSSERALSVGALLPSRFLPPVPGEGAAPDAVAYFSSRGGELAKPDLITPGVAYSTVPAWDRGGEIEGGTSMASPHAAGLAALLLSAARQDKRSFDAATIRRALMVTAARLPGAGYADQGAGVPDVARAWQWLLLGRTVPGVSVRAESGTPAALLVAAPGTPVASSVVFDIRNRPGTTDTFRLRSGARWLTAPSQLVLHDSARVALAIDTAAIGLDPVTGVVSGWTADSLAGPAFRLVTTLARAAGSTMHRSDTLAASNTRQLFFAVEAGRPLSIRVSSLAQGVQAFLSEPGGMPFRDGNVLNAGTGDDAALFRVDASDARPGLWQLSTVTSSAAAVVSVDIRPSPATMTLVRKGDSVIASLSNQTDSTVRGAVLMGVLGTEQQMVERGSGAAVVRRTLEVPQWARFLVLDLAMPVPQWEQLTDFGIALLDTTGSQLEQSPLNYAEGRMHHAFEAPPGRVTLALYPGFADSAAAASWTADIRLRFYAEDPTRLSASGPRNIEIAPRATTHVTEAWASPSWDIPDSALPLGVVTLETADGDWTSERVLPAPVSGASTR
jgi:subtilisin family serine protease